jgi:signal transduction histidine kinase
MLLRVQMMRERANKRDSLYSDLERLEQSIGFCQQFVRRLLDFSRRSTFTPEPEAIGPVIHAAVSFLMPSFVRKGARVVVDTCGLDEITVLADRNNLETLLLILLSNSLDAIGDAGQISVQLARTEPDIQIVIRDNGSGISAADQKRVFEPFFTTKPIGKGTGLGLPIAKNIVTEHGGDIRLESIPDAGTTATVSFPIYAKPKAPSRQ